MSPDDKDAALLPYRMGGLWALMHRPMTPLGAHIWISYSPDLHHWVGHRVMMEARKGAWWDANKIGLCSPPIETERGWLVLYHGVRQNASGSLYRIGLALFDIHKPDICLLRGDPWIFGPETDYERGGDVHDGGIPVRTHDRSRERHHQYLLWCSRFLHSSGPIKRAFAADLGWKITEGRVVPIPIDLRLRADASKQRPCHSA